MTHDVIQVLSSPAWTGIGVIASSIISTIALIFSLPILKIDIIDQN